MRAEWQTARALMERLLTLAQRVHHPTLLMHAHLGLGGILYCLGAFAAVREHIEQGLALYDPQTHTPAVSDAVHDPEVVGRCYAAGALWHLGYPEQARQHLDAALTRAQELAHPFTLAQVFYCATIFALVRREVQVAGERAEALITLATAQGFPFQLAGGMLCRGLVLIEQGQQEEGMRQIRQGLAAHRATGAAAGQPYALAFLARAYGQDGQSDKGQQVLDEALALVHRTGGAVLRGGAVSAQRRAAAPGRQKTQGTEHGAKAGGSGAEFASGPRRRPPPAGEVPGAAGGDESGSVVATAGQRCSKPTPVWSPTSPGWFTRA